MFGIVKGLGTRRKSKTGIVRNRNKFDKTYVIYTHTHTCTHLHKWCHGIVANSGMWVDVNGVLSRCRFGYLISDRHRYA